MSPDPGQAVVHKQRGQAVEGHSTNLSGRAVIPTEVILMEVQIARYKTEIRDIRNNIFEMNLAWGRDGLSGTSLYNLL